MALKYALKPAVSAKGDDFIIMPTRKESSQLAMNLTRPEQVAIASAVTGRGHW